MDKETKTILDKNKKFLELILEKIKIIDRVIKDIRKSKSCSYICIHLNKYSSDYVDKFHDLPDFANYYLEFHKSKYLEELKFDSVCTQYAFKFPIFTFGGNAWLPGKYWKFRVNMLEAYKEHLLSLY